MKCGLLGQQLGHSYSPAIHKMLGNYDYQLFEKEPWEVADFLKNGDFSGLNVTMPYKKAVIPFLDELSDTAARLGAVNTVVRRPDGRLIGHNTDYFGFQSLLEHSTLPLPGCKALVLGSGGASQTAQDVLTRLGTEVVVISRCGANRYEDLPRHRDATLIVNATPVGMYPHCWQSPVNLEIFPQLEAVVDLIYNPARTALLLDAERRGAKAVNGLWMLAAQAVQSARLFTGAPIPPAQIGQICERIRRATENIVLIGMPGCGKSAVAARLSEALQMPLVDTDAEIEKMAKKSIPAIFAEDGEAVFRAWESEVIAAVGKGAGQIIATGGGCVISGDNKAPLRQNGRIFWLRRDISKLATQGRPLSTDLQALYARREGLYRDFADISVDNNGTLAQTVMQIMEAI